MLLEHFVVYADVEYFVIDSKLSVLIPARMALRKTGVQAEQTLRRSRGGFSTNIHIGVDGLGDPLYLRLTCSQRHDIMWAEALIEGFRADYVIAHKVYEAIPFRALVVNSSAEAVIPSTLLAVTSS